MCTVTERRIFRQLTLADIISLLFFNGELLGLESAVDFTMLRGITRILARSKHTVPSQKGKFLLLFTDYSIIKRRVGLDPSGGRQAGKG